VEADPCFHSIHRNPNVSSIPGPKNSVQSSSECTAQSEVPITPTPSTPLLLHHRRLASPPPMPAALPDDGGGRARRRCQLPQLCTSLLSASTDRRHPLGPLHCAAMAARDAPPSGKAAPTLKRSACILEDARILHRLASDLWGGDMDPTPSCVPAQGRND
jgi:hypothetical protein